MNRNLQLLADQHYDLIIVGGGFFGICAAWDAVQRGLSVALIEQGDWSAATSANHFRMIHGGIRYLQHGDVYRVRESSYERSAMLRVAPHLVHPLPIVIPTYGHGMKGKEILTAGALLYDLLTVDRNRGIPDPKRHIPAGRAVSRQEILEMFPEIPSQGLTGAVIFHDGQTYHPSRLGLAFLKSAVEAGLQAANYLEAVEFLKQGNQVVGVKAHDRLGGQDVEIRGRIVLNTAGPWAPSLLDNALGIRLNPAPTFSRDACFIVKKKLVGNFALTVLGKTKDPDAILSRGARHLFIVPWQDCTLVGVWHVVHQGKPDDFTVTAEDLQCFLDEINVAYPPLNLTLEDISNWMAGLVLFGEHQKGEEDLSYGHRSQIIDHAVENQIDGLVTLIGVRYTTARGMAERVVDLVYQKLGLRPVKSQTAETPVYGGRIENFDALVNRAIQQRPQNMDERSIPALVHHHGTAYLEVLAHLNADRTLAENIPGSQVIRAEVVHGVREEMAVKLSDVVYRRTDLGQAGYPGDEALQACAELMAAELGWSGERTQQEVEEVKATYPPFLRPFQEAQTAVSDPRA